MTDQYCPGCQSSAGIMGCPDHNQLLQRTEFSTDRKQPFKCPVCDGQGLVSRPPNVADNVTAWVGNTTIHPCHACDGKGIVWG